MKSGKSYGNPTEYNGQHYDSYTEARWAAFFDYAGIRFEREPLTFGWMKDSYDVMTGEPKRESVYYTPDFYLQDQDVLIEIKNGNADLPCGQKLSRVARHAGFAVMLLDGTPGHFTTYLYSPDPTFRPRNDDKAEQMLANACIRSYEVVRSTGHDDQLHAIFSRNIVYSKIAKFEESPRRAINEAKARRRNLRQNLIYLPDNESI